MPATAPTSTAALRLQDLTRWFGDTLAVDHVDLTVERGELTALLGPSGCGKTTVLRLVAGLLRPDDGTIEIDGRVVADRHRVVPPERRQVGMVFQDYALFPHLSVAGNVAFGLRHLPRPERDRHVGDALGLVGMAGLGDRLPTELSGGQQQRVALARALAPQPQLLLLDEPFSNLDAALRSTVREEVRAILREAEQTAVFVTHDQEEALSLADRVAVMADGRVHQHADPQTLYTRPATRFVAGFVGEADLLPARRAGRYLVDTPIGRLATDAPVETDQVAVVIRPEALRLRSAPDGDAIVRGLSFHGHDQLVTIEVAQGFHLRARRGPTLDLARGDRVRLEVEGSVVAFPYEPAAATIDL